MTIREENEEKVVVEQVTVLVWEYYYTTVVRPLFRFSFLTLLQLISTPTTAIIAADIT